MAKPTSRNAQGPRIQTGTTSTAGQGGVTPGPSFRGEPEGIQIARSLQRFASASSKLGKMQMEEENEKMVVKAQMEALQGVENSNPTNRFATRAYNAQLGVNRITKMQNEVNAYFASDDGRALDEQSAKAYLAKQYDGIAGNLSGDELMWTSRAFIQMQPRMWAGRNQQHQAYRKEQSTSAWTEAVRNKFATYSTLTGGAREEAVEGVKGWMSRQMDHDDFMNLNQSDLRQITFPLMEEQIQVGDDTMLVWAEGSGKYSDPAEVSKLNQLRAKYDKAQRLALTEENIAVHTQMDDGIASGWTNEEIDAHIDANPFVYKNATPKQVANLRKLAQANRTKIARAGALDEAFVEGTVANVHDATPDELNKTADRFVVNTLREFPGMGGYLRISDKLVQNGMVSPALRARFTGMARSLPTIADGQVSQSFADAYSLYQTMKKAGYGKMHAQFGDEAVAVFEQVGNLATNGDMDLSSAAYHVRQAMDSPLSAQDANRQIAQMEERFDDRIIFGDDSIIDPIAREEIDQMASLMVRSGLVGGEHAMEIAHGMARDKWLENHTTLAGRYVNIEPERLQRLWGTSHSADETWEYYFESDDRKQAILDILPDLGLTPDDINAQNIRLSVLEDGKRAYLFYDDPNGVPHVSPQVVNLVEFGVPQHLQERGRILKAIHEDLGDAVQEINQMQRDITMSLSNPYDSPFYQWDKRELGITLDEWNAMDKKERDQFTVDMVKKDMEPFDDFVDAVKEKWRKNVRTTKNFGKMLGNLFGPSEAEAIGAEPDQVPGRPLQDPRTDTRFKTATSEKHGIGKTDSLQETIAKRESGGDYTTKNRLGYLGAYQFGKPALEDLGYWKKGTGWTGKNGINSEEDFLESKEVQDVAYAEWEPLLRRYLDNKGALEYVGKQINGIDITESGLIMAAHLVGAGAVSRWLRGGKEPLDGNKVPASHYLELGNYRR